MQFNTRGSSGETLSFEESLSILQKATALSVKFDNIEEFRAEVEKAKEVIDDCKEYLKTGNISLAGVNEVQDKLAKIGFKTKLSSKINTILDSIKRVQLIKKRRYEIDKLEKNLE